VAPSIPHAPRRARSESAQPSGTRSRASDSRVAPSIGVDAL
jgi:hypothetical protein